MSRRSRTLVAISVGLLLAAAGAAARVPWYEHYKRGLELEALSAWEPAIRAFETAARLEPRPRAGVVIPGQAALPEYDPYYHLAVCLTELGRYPAAAVQLRSAFKAGVTPRPKLDALRDRIENAVRDRLATPTPAPEARLSVTTRPGGAKVTLDGTPLGSTPLGPTLIAPGTHTVAIAAAGFEPLQETLTAEAGTTYELDRDLSPQPTPTPRHVAKVGPASVAPAATVPGPTVPPATPAPPTPAPVATARPEAAPTPDAGVPGWLLPALSIALALALVIALGAAWWLRRRRTPLDAAHTPTRVIETAATQVKGGTELGPYTLVATLGRGGMATTYRATRRSDGTEVAVKVPHESCLADPTYQTRFVREGRLGEQLHHPRIVRIFDADAADGRPFLAMELLAGRTLKQELRERGPLPVRRALEIATDIAEALDYAHAKGVVHRDLKPENVMILPDGSVKVMDFGIARLAGQEGLTSSQFFLGTPLYAAPEMIEPKGIDQRVDLYSLGIIVFEMIEGTVPFAADSPFRVLQMHQSEPLPAAEALARPVPERVWRLIEKLCSKSPADRYPSAELLLVELHALLRDFSTLGRDGD